MYMRFVANLICLWVALTLAGCASSRYQYVPELTPDYRLQVRQNFADLPNGTYLDFQQGQLIQPGNLDRWSTYCRLYVYNPEQGADYRTTVVTGTIAISEVKAAYYSSDYPVHPFFGHLSWGVRDIPDYYLYQLGMRLSAPDQPELRSLVCYKKWAVPRADQYPTLAEIREALGDRISIESPG